MKAISAKRLFVFFLLLFAGAMPFSIALTQSALVLAVAFWVWTSIEEKRTPVPRTPFDWFFLAFIAVEIVSTLCSADRRLSLEHFIKRALLIPIVYLIAGSVRTRDLLRRVLLALIGVMVVVSFIGIVKYHLGPGGLSGRLKLFHHYMTSGGILMIIGLLAAAFVFTRAPRRVRIAAGLAVLVFLFPLFYTFTRSAWLGFLAGLFFMIFHARRRLLLAVVPALVLAYLAAPPATRDRIGSIVQPRHRYNIERLYMWEAGVRMILARPLCGYGDAGLGEIADTYRAPEAKDRGGHLHNNFIMFGAILGLPGLAVMLALFARIFIVELKILLSVPRDDWLCRGAALGSVAAYIGFHVAGLFEWNFGDAEIAMLLWLTVGLSLAARNIRSGPPRVENERNPCASP